MMLLILPSEAQARARSRAAYQAANLAALPGLVTRALWTWRAHPSDGRAALEIPGTPAEAGLGLPPSVYEALLTADERAALVTMPPVWRIEPAP